MYSANNFEDEPGLEGIDKFEDIPVPSEKVRFDGLDEAAAKAERRRKRRRRRNQRTGMIAACILLVCILIGVIISATVVEETEHMLYQDAYVPETEMPSTSPTTAKPTMHTTPSPTVARKPTFHVKTPSPTIRHTPSPNLDLQTDSPTETPGPTSIMTDVYTFEPVGDTYMYLDGNHKVQAYGHEDSLWVQRGNKESTLPGHEVTIPTIVGLLEFDTTQETPTNMALPKRSRWPAEAENNVVVTLRLHHVAKSDSDELAVEDILPVNIEVYRLPNNHDWVVESLTGDDFQNSPKAAREGILVAQHVIEGTDTLVDINVESAIFLPEDINARMYKDDQVLLLLKVYWEEAPNEGDSFETRESDGRSPQLIFSNMM